ncbi:MAG TPA: DUF3300 domain-containing protein [Bryobacteraceae bacterium]|nr:DUF3300 domain-containing protein [Bryobacteraceae bacterium]
MTRQWLQSFPMTLAAVGLVVCLTVTLTPAEAQAPAASPPPPQVTPTAPRLSMQQLDNLVSPVALYPDPMLSQLLVASTYPLELMEAEQWLKANPGLQGSQLMNAAKQQNWDPSVQAMVAFPEVLDRLTQDVRWTSDLGNAFLAQQGDVMAAVQRMRTAAEARGKLSSDSHQTVSTVSEGGQTAVQIMPADPQVIYVPSYDPAYIWGPPVWGLYPALWYPPYGWGFWPGVSVGLWFGGWGWGGGWAGWGWCPAWFHGGVWVNHGFFNHFGFHGVWAGAGRTIWAHNPAHRLGVPYSTAGLNNRFGAASIASRANAMRANSGSWGMHNSFGPGMHNSFGPGMHNSFGPGMHNSFGPGMHNSFGPGMHNSLGQGTAPRMNPGGPAAQGFRGGMPGMPRNFSPPSRVAPNYNGGAMHIAPNYNGGAMRGYGGAMRGYGGGGFHGFGGGGGFHGFGGGGGFGGGHFGGGGFGGGHFGGGGGHGGGHR